ncbi:MAG: helix-turn-helix domain-containing protein [Phocaeicola sp.]
MKERISSVIAKEGVTAAQFAEKIGISASSLSHILSGRNNPSLEVVTKIHKACSYVDLNWLLYGEGTIDSEATTVQGGYVPCDKGGENLLFPTDGAADSNNGREMVPETHLNAPKEIVREQIKYIEIPSKKITEIRIFFDNGTYETFRADSK